MKLEEIPVYTFYTLIFLVIVLGLDIIWSWLYREEFLQNVTLTETETYLMKLSEETQLWVA